MHMAAWRTPKIWMQRFCIRMWIFILNDKLIFLVCVCVCVCVLKIIICRKVYCECIINEWDGFIKTFHKIRGTLEAMPWLL